MKNFLPLSFLRRKQIYELLGQFLETGVPIDAALSSMVLYYPSGKIGKIMLQLTHEFKEQQHFSRALDKVLGPLPVFEKMAFQSAEAQGHLGKAIDNMAEILAKREEFLKDILENLQGPALSLHGALLLYLGMEYFGAHSPSLLIFGTKTFVLFFTLWTGLFFLGRRFIQALSGEGNGPGLPFFSHLNSNMAQYHMILAYQGLLEAGITRIEIHAGILSGLGPFSRYKKDAEEAFTLIHAGIDVPPKGDFLPLQEWTEWALARKSGKESEILLKISERLKKKLERNFRQYFVWANRILRFLILALVGFLIYKMNVDRLQSLNDIDLNP